MPASSAESHLSGLGVIRALERRLAEHYGMRYALAMPSATTGLLALGLALDLQGALFVTTPLTWGGSLAPWLMLGGTPLFSDVDPDTLTLDPALIGIEQQSGARAILAVDLFGQPCDDEALREAADDMGAWLIVDGAQSFGARREGRASGIHAHAVVLSFTAGKPLDVGEGGAVLTNDRDIYERLIWHSQHPTRQKLELGLRVTNEFAINGRMAPVVAQQVLNDVPSALGRIERRRQTVNCIKDHLVDVDFPAVGCCESAWFRLTGRIPVSGLDPRSLESLALDYRIDVAIHDFPTVLLPAHPSFPLAVDSTAEPYRHAMNEASRRSWIQFSRRAELREGDEMTHTPPALAALSRWLDHPEVPGGSSL